MWKIYCIILMLLIGHFHSIRSESMSRNEITNSVYEANRGRGWMDTAKDALAGPAGKMVVHFAKEMISRSTGNSQSSIHIVHIFIRNQTQLNDLTINFTTDVVQINELSIVLYANLYKVDGAINKHEFPNLKYPLVHRIDHNHSNYILSLNLTNLLILVFLKALIFSAGLIGAGNWSHYARGRRDDASFAIKPEEPQLFLGFLAAEGSGDDTCLHNAACSSTQLATEYVKAAKAIIKTAEMLDAELTNDLRYRELIQKTERAIAEGMAGAPCDIIYHCRI